VCLALLLSFVVGQDSSSSGESSLSGDPSVAATSSSGPTVPPETSSSAGVPLDTVSESTGTFGVNQSCHNVTRYWTWFRCSGQSQQRWGELFPECKGPPESCCWNISRNVNVTDCKVVEVNVGTTIVTTIHAYEYDPVSCKKRGVAPLPTRDFGENDDIAYQLAGNPYVIVPADVPQAVCNFTKYLPQDSYRASQLCVVIGGNHKIIFYPKVDEFSLLQISMNASQREAFDHPDMWIRIEFSDKMSPLKHRRKRSRDILANIVRYDFVVPFWTAIIQLKDGLAESITWDDGCYGCSDLPCYEATCGIRNINCYAGKVDCDIKIYLGWFGTDKSGRYLTSAGKRLSRFRAYSVKSAYDTASETAINAIPDPPQFTGTLEGEAPAPDSEVGTGGPQSIPDRTLTQHLSDLTASIAQSVSSFLMLEY